MLLAACNSGPKFLVEGRINNAADSILHFEANTLDGIASLDSVKLGENGSFSFSAPAPSNPEFYTLRIGKKRIHFSIDSTETVSFEADIATMSTDYKVSGSENSVKIKEIHLMQQALQQKIISLEKNKSMYPGDITDSINALINRYKEKIKAEYIFKEPTKAYAYYAVCQSITDLYSTFMIFDPLNDRSDVKCYATVATAWDGQYHDAPRTIQICNAAIKGMKNTAKPTTKYIEIDESLISETGIIDVVLPDANGKEHNIKDLKGKVVILDFTIYDSTESSQRNMQMRELYNKYKSKGLEIFQISLDTDMHFWKIATENLPWICVHETDGKVTGSYAITKLPTLFLINRENEIVKRDNMITDLETEIKNLL